MEKLTFRAIDGLLGGKLSLTIQGAREIAEEKGFGRGYAWGKDRILGMVGWESDYCAGGDSEKAKIKKTLKSSEAYYAVIKQLEAECIKGNERHLEALEREEEAIS